jgi:hypothetical protein
MDVHQSALPPCSAVFYRQQEHACRAIADRRPVPLHRATFLRLAWHWRVMAGAVDDVVVLHPGSLRRRA